MTDTPTERDQSIWTRLRRRKVVQWGIAYVAGAWGLLQGLEYLSSTFEWSRHDAAVRRPSALIVGLPIVLVLAWYHGDRGEQRVRGTELVIVTLLFLVGGGLLWSFDRARVPTVEASATAARSAAPAPAPDEKSIAVLPFTNVTGDPGQDIVADGLAEEVANQLAAIPELRVTGRRSSFSFKGRNEDLRVIAKKLDVANLLEGSLRSDGTRLRVTVQLIDGRDGTRRWSSRPYEHEQSGILAAQDEIAQDVARALSVTLDVGALNRAQGGTMNLEAARRYWEWRELMLSERRGVELERRRVRLMRDAVRLDPQFVVAWDGLAESLSDPRVVRRRHPARAGRAAAGGGGASLGPRGGAGAGQLDRVKEAQRRSAARREMGRIRSCCQADPGVGPLHPGTGPTADQRDLRHGPHR